MQIILHYNDINNEKYNTSLKITLNHKWQEGNILQVKNFFLKSLFKKHSDLSNILNENNCHIEHLDGVIVSDMDIVGLVVENGDEVFVKIGPSPTEPTKTKQTIINKDKKKEEDPEDNNDFIASASALEKAKEKAKLAFDYSKWDRLDLSDDDDADCHPNIDKASWKRLKGQMRQERRTKEEEKIDKLKGKIEKHSGKVLQIEKELLENENNEELKKKLKEAKASVQNYQQKLDTVLSTRKLIAADLCETKENVTKIAPVVETKPIQAATLPKSEDEELSEYDQFVKKHKKMLMEYSKLRHDDDTEEFMRLHPEVLDAHAEGYFLLLCLHTAMKHVESDRKDPNKSEKKKEEEFQREMQISRQHLYIQYILELAKSGKMDPRAAVHPFFVKTSKQSPQQIKGFDDDLRAFVKRIRNRANEKIDKGESSPLADDGEFRSSAKDDDEMDQDIENYELAPPGPGGLDPNEVLQSLPQDMQKAFVDQDTEKLKAVLMAMPEQDAAYHFQRCIDSGLWVEKQ